MTPVRTKINIGKKNAHEYYFKKFGSYLVLPELKKGNSGEWLIKIRCLECGEERFFKPSSLWKRGKCTCVADRKRIAGIRAAQEKATPQAPKPKAKKPVPFKDLTEIWPSVIRAGRNVKHELSQTEQCGSAD